MESNRELTVSLLYVSVTDVVCNNSLSKGLRTTGHTLGPTNLGYYYFGYHNFSHKFHVRDLNMLVIYDFL